MRTYELPFFYNNNKIPNNVAPMIVGNVSPPTADQSINEKFPVSVLVPAKFNNHTTHYVVSSPDESTIRIYAKYD